MLFDIPGFNGFYKIDKQANIFSKNGEYKMKPFKHSWWYLRVSLCKNWIAKTYYLHRLMGATFLGLDINNENDLICHKDDNKQNNSIENLFIWSFKDNMQDMIKKWRQSIWINHQIKSRGELSKKSKITNEQAKQIKKQIQEGIKLRIIAENIWTNLSIVKNISCGKAWKWLK